MKINKKGDREMKIRLSENVKAPFGTFDLHHWMGYYRINITANFVKKKSTIYMIVHKKAAKIYLNYQRS